MFWRADEFIPSALSANGADSFGQLNLQYQFDLHERALQSVSFATSS